MPKHLTFEAIREEFDQRCESDSGTDRPLRDAMHQTLDLLASFLPPQVVVDNTEKDTNAVDP